MWQMAKPQDRSNVFTWKGVNQGPIDQPPLLMEELPRRPIELGLSARAALARTFAVAKLTRPAAENEPWGNMSMRIISMSAV